MLKTKYSEVSLNEKAWREMQSKIRPVTTFLIKPNPKESAPPDEESNVYLEGHLTKEQQNRFANGLLFNVGEVVDGIEIQISYQLADFTLAKGGNLKPREYCLDGKNIKYKLMSEAMQKKLGLGNLGRVNKFQ